MNIFDNAIFLFVMIVVLLAWSLSMFVLDSVHTNTKNILVENNSYMNKFDIYDNLTGFFKQAFNFMTAFLVMLLFISSNIDITSVRTYFIIFVGGVLFSSVLIYVTNQIYTSFVTYGSLQGMEFTEIPNWFITNLQYLFILNLVAGLLAFIFVRPRAGVGTGT